MSIERLVLNLDGGDCEIDTGIGFFDHMLTAFSVHGGFGLKITCRGDLNVDCLLYTSVEAALLHDTVEDTDITLDYIKHEFGDDVAALVDGVTTVSYTHLALRSSRLSLSV